jgi:hypothetical protein
MAQVLAQAGIRAQTAGAHLRVRGDLRPGTRTIIWVQRSALALTVVGAMGAGADVVWLRGAANVTPEVEMAIRANQVAREVFIGWMRAG